jgi:hypothetical protein
MTTSTKHENASQTQPLGFLVFLGLMLLDIGVRRYWPGSMGSTIVKYVYLCWVPIWFAFRIRAGYLRRRPHWTRESWFRYLRLAAMPVLAVALVLYLSSFDPSSNALGAPHTATRTVLAISLVGMLLLGAVGLGVATDWLTRGEPSEQFTRTRWFQRRRAPG